MARISRYELYSSTKSHFSKTSISSPITNQLLPKSAKMPIKTHGYHGFIVYDSKAIHIAKGAKGDSYTPPPPFGLTSSGK